MQSCKTFTVVAAVNDREILRRNLLLSPEISQTTHHRLLLKYDYPSAATAYNSALDEATNDLVAFVHQDVYFPAGWFSTLSRAIDEVERRHGTWGVIGCFGVSARRPKGVGRIYSTGWGRIGWPIAEPEPVETLDEIVLIIRKSMGLRFDEALPHFHLYGADICMMARASGRVNYAFPGYCVHNTNQILSLPDEFYRCYRYIKAKWKRYLPIRTPCITISRFDGERRWKRLQEIRAKAWRSHRMPARRTEDPRPFAIDEPAASGDERSAEHAQLLETGR